MSKLKTHKGVKSRVKISGTGKMMHGKAGRRHLLTRKSSRRMKHLRGSEEVSKVHAQTLRRLLPYG